MDRNSTSIVITANGNLIKKRCIKKGGEEKLQLKPD